jgi:hypothetical protein
MRACLARSAPASMVAPSRACGWSSRTCACATGAGISGLGAISPPPAATSRTMSYFSIVRSTNPPASAGRYSLSPRPKQQPQCCDEHPLTRRTKSLTAICGGRLAVGQPSLQPLRLAFGRPNKSGSYGYSKRHRRQAPRRISRPLGSVTLNALAMPVAVATNASQAVTIATEWSAAGAGTNTLGLNQFILEALN